MSKLFNKILIANRGEIAVRIMRSCRRLGIATVAVYSAADAKALHVRMADEAVFIGPAPAAQSYLRIEAIIAAAQKTGAEAIHPGYGFLSENEDFAEACVKAGIVFIGPNAKAIAAMGDKIESKKLAIKAGVSVVPGFVGEIADAAAAVKVAADIGYPVMLKASAGGGGKGLRIAHNDAELQEALSAARNEARNAFGDERVFIEKYIEQPRHIEIQILGDKHGHIIYLGERECSLQRRHQKVIEEAPSPFLSASTRAAMGAQAVALAAAVGYFSAGTIEFIVAPDQRFYFLEMNTRLQVEHPVTEAVTGLDLVEWMIRIAAGQPLSLQQADVKMQGHAIEARLYAEDPSRNFLPAIGRLTYLAAPIDARFDSAVEAGDEISIFYDPMIAKLITHGESRASAQQKMLAALNQLQLEGLVNNRAFLQHLLASEAFTSGQTHTGVIAEYYPQGYSAGLPVGAALLRAKAIAVMAEVAYQKQQYVQNPPNFNHSNWVAVVGDNIVPLQYEAFDAVAAVNIGTDFMRLTSDWQLGQSLWQGTIDDVPQAVQIKRHGYGWHVQQDGWQISLQILPAHLAPLAALMPAPKARPQDKALRSPMPGLLVQLAVKEGQAVKAGQVLAVVEAMKMENALRATGDGVVAKIHAEAGSTLSLEQIILEFAA